MTLLARTYVLSLLLLGWATFSHASESVFLLPDAVDWESAVEQVQRRQVAGLTSTIAMENSVVWLYLDLSQSSSRILHLGNP